MRGVARQHGVGAALHERASFDCSGRTVEGVTAERDRQLAHVVAAPGEDRLAVVDKARARRPLVLSGAQGELRGPVYLYTQQRRAVAAVDQGRVQALEDAVAAVIVDGERLDAGAAAEEVARGARDEDGAVVLCVRIERVDLLGRAPEGLRCERARQAQQCAYDDGAHLYSASSLCCDHLCIVAL